MQLTVKTLKGIHFEIRVQPSDTVIGVKKNIEDVQGTDNYPCAHLLLIHNGKVLKDETTLAENNVSADGFLVVMLSKSKSLASGSSVSSQGIPETSEVAVPVASVPGGQATETGASPAAPNSAPLNMFPEEPHPAAGGIAHLGFLRDNRQFQALRSMVQLNPDILQPVLQELGKQSPDLVRMIEEHHAEFRQLINEPHDISEEELFDPPSQDLLRAINITPGQQAAIERLEARGFPRPLVIEAFLACDRNEELAANYLLKLVANNFRND